jgi:NADH:ubiquinone oxidoreductase subunit
MAEGILAKFRQWSSIVRHYGGLKNTVLALYRYDDLKVGKCVGADKYGNHYYQNTRYFVGRSRWVKYADRVGLDYDASQIPPEWHRWLQYISDETPVEKPLKRQSWMIDTIENKTGTSQIYVPYTTVRTKIESWQPPLPSTTQNTTATKS